MLAADTTRPAAQKPGRTFEEILAGVPHSTLVDLGDGRTREHTFSEQDRIAIVRETIMLEEEQERLAKGAGWTIGTTGEWERIAFAWEPSNVPEIGHPRMIRVDTAEAACRWDRLGRFAYAEPEIDKVAQLSIEGLARAMRVHRDNCTEQVLAAEGYPVAYQHQHQDAAVAIARLASVTHIADHAVTQTEEATVASMRADVGAVLPSLANLLAMLKHLKDVDGTRRYSDRQINRYLRRVVHMAARDFISILPAVPQANPGART